MEFHDIGQSGRIEYLAINLFDENKQLMFLFYIHDGWTAPDHFGTRISYYESGDSETSWIDRYSDWRGILRIGLDQDSGAILCSQGSAPETTLIEAGMFNVSRVITYIGIYGLRRDGYLPNDDRMRIHDIIANYSIEQTTTTTSTTTSTATTPTTTSSSPTSPTIPTESDVMVFVIIGVGGGALAVIAIVIVLLRRNPAGGSSQEPYSW